MGQTTLMFLKAEKLLRALDIVEKKPPNLSIGKRPSLQGRAGGWVNTLMFLKDEKLLKVHGIGEETRSPRREVMIVTGGLQV